MRSVLGCVLGAAFVFGAAPIASAADRMVMKAPPAAVANWSACYVGINGGYASAPKDWTFIDGTFVPVGSHTAKGWAAGGQIGCDWQVNSIWVLGARVMYDWADLTGSNIETAFTGHTVNTQVRGFGTAVARAGWQANPSLVFYVLGGLAWVHDKHWEANRTTGGIDGLGYTTRVGFDVGVGAEYLINPNWSVFVEYDYMGFGTRRVDLNLVVAPGIEQYDIKQSLQKVLVGLNWRWNSAGLGRW